jgi:hypothetical protein
VSSKASLSDYGLVGLVGGAVGLALLGAFTLVAATFFGGVPIVLVILLGAVATIFATSAVLLIIGSRGAGDEPRDS